MQGKQKKRYHMDKAGAAVDDLPTAKVDTGYKPIDRKDEQTILPAKPSCLSGEHTDRPLQVWITGKQRTDWSVQAKDRKADRKHIQPLKFTKRERQETGNRAQAHSIDKVALICQQIPHKVSKHVPAMACMSSSLLEMDAL